MRISTTSPLLAILLCWTILSLSLPPPLFVVAAAFTATASTATRSFGKEIKNWEYKTNKMCPREAIKRSNCLAMSEDSYDFKKFTTSVELRRAVRAYLDNDQDPRGLSSARLKYGDLIGSWDVSKISDFNSVFTFHYDYDYDHIGAPGLEDFNEDISEWDVSRATNMAFMFCCDAFNQDISKWDVSTVSDMNGMFDGASSFNQDISKWNVS